MKRQILMISTATALLGACAVTNPTDTADGDKPAVPEAIVQLAGPGQNVETARLLPSDNCYWYEYVGVVETTLLPLKTADGRRICAQGKDKA